MKENLTENQNSQSVDSIDGLETSGKWAWKHNNEAVEVVEECEDRIYYAVKVVRFAEKSKFKSVSNRENTRKF